MRKKILIIFIIITLLIPILNSLVLNSIKFDYYTSVETTGSNKHPWWEVIRSKEELSDYNKYLDLDLEKFKNIDFSKNAIILSNGRKINKIVYRKRSTIFSFLIYNYSGIAYLQNEYYDNIIFVYLIDKNKKLFVDRHFDEDTQYIIEK